LVEGSECSRGVDVIVALPAVVTVIITLPLDQIFESTVSNTAVEDLVNFVSRLTFDDLWRRWWLRTTTFDRISGVQFELRDRENRVETLHRVRQAKSVSSTTEESLDEVGSEPLIS
jgi:hypothetical protein